MNLDDLTPANGGSLRGRPVFYAGQQVATFSTPELNHDEVWQSALRGSEPAPSDVQEQATQRDAKPGRLGTDRGDGFDLQGTSSMIRSALRPGG